MIYLIDGYNLLFRQQKKKLLSIDDERLSLLKKIATYAQKSSVKIYIVFDSQEEIYSHFENLSVIYTRSQETADEYLLNLVASVEKPHQLTLISADREVTGKGKQLGAKVMSPESFLKTIQAKTKTLEEEKPKPLHNSAIHYLSIFEERFEKLRKDTPPKKPKKTAD